MATTGVPRELDRVAIMGPDRVLLRLDDLVDVPCNGDFAFWIGCVMLMQGPVSAGSFLAAAVCRCLANG